MQPDNRGPERPEAPRDPAGPVVVTGGAGFIGSNLADRLLAQGREVIVFDSLARPGVEANLAWLQARHGDRLTFHRGDVRDRDAVAGLCDGAAAVYHFAAQVAVTTSLDDPRTDFEVNAGGTLNLLEEVRRQPRRPLFVYTSTNKVYGNLSTLGLQVNGQRHEPEFRVMARGGIDESWPLDLYTPYGCSKGAADQYVLDYGRAYGMPTVVFRMSCIYGPRQMGTEDQGWVAHLLRLMMESRPVTLYGDGMQVRDILFVDDLVDALTLAWTHAGVATGRAFNIGGGPSNTISLLELLERGAVLNGRPAEIRFQPWRTGDQRWYVSNIGAFRATTGWFPRVGVAAGVTRLHEWLESRAAEPAAHGGGT
jgi:CDP-paratose 2-epimerase